MYFYETLSTKKLNIILQRCLFVVEFEFPPSVIPSP